MVDYLVDIRRVLAVEWVEVPIQTAVILFDEVERCCRSHALPESVEGSTRAEYAMSDRAAFDEIERLVQTGLGFICRNQESDDVAQEMALGISMFCEKILSKIDMIVALTGQQVCNLRSGNTAQQTVDIVVSKFRERLIAELVLEVARVKYGRPHLTFFRT